MEADGYILRIATRASAKLDNDYLRETDWSVQNKDQGFKFINTALAIQYKEKTKQLKWYEQEKNCREMQWVPSEEICKGRRKEV